MNHTWSLKALYPDFNAPSFSADMTALENAVATLDNKADGLSDAQSIEAYMVTLEEIRKLSSKLYAFCNLSFSTDTSNQMALQMRSKLQILTSNLTSPMTKFMNFLAKLEDIDAFIASSEILNKFAFVLKESKNRASYLLSEQEEILASKLSITGSKAWNTLQQKLTSTLKATVNLNGEKKELPITVIRNMAYDPDPSVRKEAYTAELAAYKKIDEAVAMSLNSIKGEVLTLSGLRGYTSPLHMTLEQSRMTKATLDAMLEAMKKSMPQFHKYLKTKAKLLGHENGLPFYDLFAPIGNATKQFTYEEGCQFVLDNFKLFSDKLAETARIAMEKKWIDVEPREGKVSGAFCSSLHPLGEFRVLLNYTGNLGDVTTMAHELGHGYHAICTNEESILNIDYPMPLAETASTFCETIVNNAALKIATDDEALTILENSLQDATQVILDIYSRFLFESTLFSTREDHPLSVEELNQAMLNAQKQAYGDGLDHEILHPNMWLIKPHYYSAGLNFYNFPYAFGLLFAKGLYAKYLTDPAFFIGKYDQLLAASGKMSVVDVCKIMDIDVESTDFWESSLDIISKDIEQFILLAEKTL